MRSARIIIQFSVVQAEPGSTGYPEVIKRKTGEVAKNERERTRERVESARENARREYVYAGICGYVRTRDTRACVCARRYKVNPWQPAQCAVSNKAAVLGTSMAVWVGARGVVLLIQMILSPSFSSPRRDRRSLLFSLFLPLPSPRFSSTALLIRPGIHIFCTPVK